MYSKRQVFAADLMEALDALPTKYHHAAARAAGFRFDPPDDDHAKDGRTLEFTLPAGNGTAAKEESSKSSGQVFWRVESIHLEEEPTKAPEVPDWLQQPDDFSPARFVSPPRQPYERGADDWVPLVSEERFASFLGAHLKPWIGGGEPDMPKVVNRLAAARPLHPWPAVERRHWPGVVHVVIDLSSALTPFRADLLHLLRLIQRQLGPSRVRVVCTETGVPGRWCKGSGLVEDVPRDGGAVVVLGDAGIYRQGAELDRRWVSFARSLGRAGGRPLLLAPVPPGQVSAAVCEAFEVVVLDQGLPLRKMLRPVGHKAVDAAADEAWRQRGADLLRAALFGNSHVRWPLVRQLRRVLQRAGEPVDIGTEAMLWQDDGVCVTSTACALAADHVEMARAELVALRRRDQATLDHLVRCHWQVLIEASPLLQALYAREWSQPDLRVAEAGLAQVLRNGLDDGDRLIQAAARRLWQPATTLAQCDLKDGLADFLGTLDQRTAGTIGRGGTAIQVAWSVANAEGLRAGRVPLLEGLDTAVLGWMLPHSDMPMARKVHLFVESEPASPPRTGSVFRLALRADEGDAPLSLATFRTRAGHAVITSLDGSAAGVGRAVGIIGGSSVGVESDRGHRVQVGGANVVVQPFSKPEWADDIWFEGNGWNASLPGGRELIWTPTTSLDLGADLAGVVASSPLTMACWWDKVDQNRTIPLFPGSRSRQKLKWASASGLDEWGWWAEFIVNGRRGPVTQRLRWMAPGEFLMGSRKNNNNMFFDGDKQHPVILTEGFWLADTTCTRLLWEAVMGTDPRNLTDEPLRPVENISWDDITNNFIPRLSDLIPELSFNLPTEAQWEYSCRAAGVDHYSFGDEIDIKYANYGRIHGKTLPAKTFNPNRWGIYQMHGNVWEWCRDEMTAYPEHSLVDPIMTLHKNNSLSGSKILRGGSWADDEVSCRAAARYQILHNVRVFHAGFRISAN